MSSQQRRASNLEFMLRALRYRNYRLYFGGQIISLVGTWLSVVASSWLVYRLSEEGDRPAALMLGLVGFAGQAPMAICTPLAGVWIDRWNRRTILIWTQALSMLQSFALAALALSGWINITEVIVLGMLQGIVGAFDVPARQAFAVELVDDREDLSNAIALSSSIMHAARLIGPAIAGYLIYAVGEGYCFLIDGFSFFAVILALAVMRIKKIEQPPATMHALDSLTEGVRYAFGFRPIRALLILVAVTSLSVMSQGTLMPVYAADVLGGNARTLGWLLGASGLGALTGSLYLASRRSVVGLGRVIVAASSVLGGAMICLSFSRSLAWSIPMVMLTGGSMVAQMASANTMLQTIVDDDKRGRVMALFVVSFFGVAPLGSLLAGAVATLLGVPTTLLLAGCVSVLIAVAFAIELPRLRPLIRPIYQAKGILPPMAE